MTTNRLPHEWSGPSLSAGSCVHCSATRLDAGHHDRNGEECHVRLRAELDRAQRPHPLLGLALLELGRLERDAAAVTTPEAWDGRAWESLEDAERQAFLRQAVDRLGGGLVWPIPGLEDLDLAATPELPDPRPGLLVFLEGDDTGHTVRRVRPGRGGSLRVDFMDGSFLDPWPDLVEDVGLPWPTFASAEDLAELEARRLSEPFTEGKSAAEEALDEIAALSGQPVGAWEYPGQVVRDVFYLVRHVLEAGSPEAALELLVARCKAAGLSTNLASLARPELVEATPAALRDTMERLEAGQRARLEAPTDQDAAELREIEGRLDAPAPFTTPTTRED